MYMNVGMSELPGSFFKDMYNAIIDAILIIFHVKYDSSLKYILKIY